MAEPDINTIIRDYRNFIAAADSNEQERVYWGEPAFEEIIDHINGQLKYLKQHGLLEFVDVDLGNVDELCTRAEEKEARLKEAGIVAVLGEGQTITEPKPVETKTPIKTSVTLSELLESYNKEKTSSISVKTLEQTNGHIQILIAAVGDIEVSTFNEEMLRTYRSVLDSRTVSRGGEEYLISAITKNEHIESCKQLFRHAKTFFNSELNNLFDNPDVKFKAKKNEKKKRVPFNKQELTQIFSHSIFTNVNGEYKHPYVYWAPLMALYTGSRANEIAQLRTDDIIEVDGIWCISHNLSTPDKMLKTDNERLVPIHPKLIELGFLEFVKLFKQSKYQWTDEKENHRLFKGLTLDETRGGYTKELSRWFNGGYRKETNKYYGFKHEVGIKATDNEMKDFHSFRHTFSTGLQNARVSDEISYQLTGHSDGKQLLGGAGKDYRHGVEVAKLYEDLCKLDYGEALEKVRPFFALNGEKKCRIKFNGKNTS